jgi:hypothetical protein
MNPENKYWKIECSRHLAIIFQTRVNTKHLSEKKLIEFIRILMSKYALSDDEILEQQLRIPFKKPKNYINIKRTNNKLGEPLNIDFSTQIADIYVSVSLY